MTPSSDTPLPGEDALAGIHVVERCGRLAGRVCADLLHRHGATLRRVSVAGGPTPNESTEWSGYPVFADDVDHTVLPPGQPEATDEWRRMAADADVVIVSSSGEGEHLRSLTSGIDMARMIVCVISPYGLDPGEVPVEDPSEVQLQAVSGLMATTGETGGPPVCVGVPLLELFAALNAKIAVLAALQVLRAGGGGQLVDISVFDAAVSLQGSFLGKVQDGAARGLRGGCRHPICAPWNAYPTTDGWVIICSVTNDEWRRLLAVMGREDLADDPRFESPRSRVANVDAVDECVAAWTRTRTREELTEELRRLGIPIGFVAGIADIAASDQPVPCRWQVFDTDDSAPARAARHATPPTLPLEGVRVLELGPYTAGPLAGRLLANLGAEVIKIEPPGGEVSRAWMPQIDGTSLYFTNYNAGKRSVTIDLRSDSGLAQLLALAERADVLIQNMRAGSLERLGGGAEALLSGTGLRVYCSISGYGSRGLQVPAVDTVVQAEGGLVSLIPSGGGPVKAGVSVADLLAAHWASLGVLTALAKSERVGQRVIVDVSMYDCIAWLTELAWPDRANVLPPYSLLTTSDGWVVVDGPLDSRLPSLVDDAQRLTAHGMVERLKAAHVKAVKVHELDETFELPLVRRRSLLVGEPQTRIAAGHVLATPFKLTGTPPVNFDRAPTAGGDNPALLGTAEKRE